MKDLIIYSELETKVLNLVSLSKNSNSALMLAGKLSLELSLLHEKIVKNLFWEPEMLTGENFINAKRYVSFCAKMIRKGCKCVNFDTEAFFKCEINGYSLNITVNNPYFNNDKKEMNFTVNYNVKALAYKYIDHDGIDKVCCDKVEETKESELLQVLLKAKFGEDIPFVSQGSFHEQFGYLNLTKTI